MKKPVILFCVLILFYASIFAQQNAPAPATASAAVQWKDKIVGKWSYVGTEQFGVVDTSTATQKKDMLEIKADGSFSKIEDGQSLTGTYIISQRANTITYKDAATGKTKMYYLKKSPPDKLIIEYQTPDLIRTRYIYKKA